MRRLLLILLSLFVMSGPALAKKGHHRSHHKSKHKHRSHNKKQRSPEL
jgi:hypothetical protein